MKYSYTPPKLAKYIFPSSQWHSTKEKILLTFDDSPSNSTDRVISWLNDKNIKAMFFMNKINVKNHSIVRQLVEEGHKLGNHSLNHKSLLLKSKKYIFDEIHMLNEYVKDNFGKELNHFRPPYGRIPLRLSSILKKLNMKNVMWTVIPQEYKRDLKFVKFVIEKYLIKDSIIVLHDNMKTSKSIIETLDIFVDIVKEKNLIIGNPEECLK